ncbi:MAG: HAD-IIB family hydrolase [Anaerolineales bacterium]
MRRYEILIMDVDGTLSNYSPTDLPMMPTKPVKDAILKAQKKVLVGVATSRPLIKMKPILEELKFNCYSILHNGAQIITPITLETKWMKPLSLDVVRELYKLARKYDIRMFVSNFESNLSVTSIEQLSTGLVADVFFDGVDIQVSKSVSTELSRIPDIAIHHLSSRWKDKLEISITQAEATKKSAIVEIARLLNIDTERIIGIGDAENDIPLLNACGLKVAMGNAVNELKAIADFVAPSVEDDGVRFVIEKFILGSGKF